MSMEEGKDMAREKQEIATMKPLSPMSQLFVSPSIFCVIVMTLGFHTRCNPSVIFEGVRNTWLKIPRFSSKLVMKKNGKSVWVPVNVRVEDHFIIPDLDTSNIDNPDQFIEDYTSNIANTPLDMSKPLWEFHILNIKTSYAQSLCIGRVHHSLGDGMSLISLLLACSRKTADPHALPTTPVPKKDVDSNHKCCWLVNIFWLLIRIFFITIIELLKAGLTLLFMRDTKTPLMGKPGERIRPRKIISRMINFEDVKFVKNAMEVKINDVLLGMTQTGLSRYLSKKSGKDMVAMKENVIQNIRLRGTVFVNLRPNATIEDLGEMMAKGSKCRWGNFVGMIIFPLWLRSEDDPLEYIRRAKATMDMKKNSMESLIFYGIAKITLKIFGEKALENIVKRICGHTTLTFSNVMGPNDDISFFDHPMSYLTASAFGGPQALIIHFVSYVDKIVINLAVDTTVIPDPHLLCDDLVEALDIIKLAVLEKGLHKMEV